MSKIDRIHGALRRWLSRKAIVSVGAMLRRGVKRMMHAACVSPWAFLFDCVACDAAIVGVRKIAMTRHTGLGRKARLPSGPFSATLQCDAYVIGFIRRSFLQCNVHGASDDVNQEKSHGQCKR